MHGSKRRIPDPAPIQPKTRTWNGVGSSSNLKHRTIGPAGDIPRNTGSKPPTRGVERLSLPSSRNDFAINQLLTEITRRLADEGKRVVKTQVFGDSIAIDWILDYQKVEEQQYTKNMCTPESSSSSLGVNMRQAVQPMATVSPSRQSKFASRMHIVFSEDGSERGRGSRSDDPIVINSDSDSEPEGIDLSPIGHSTYGPKEPQRVVIGVETSHDSSEESSTEVDDDDRSSCTEQPTVYVAAISEAERIFSEVSRADLSNLASSHRADNLAPIPLAATPPFLRTPDIKRKNRDTVRDGRQSNRPHVTTKSQINAGQRGLLSLQPKGNDGIRVVIPKADFARGRRVLISTQANIPLVTVAMRGDVQFLRQDSRTRISPWSLPSSDKTRHVEDACLVGNTAVIGYNKGPCEVSLIPLHTIDLNRKPVRMDVVHSAHSAACGVRDRVETHLGISCLAPVRGASSKLQFVSGGHDKCLFLWTAGVSESGTVKAKTEKLPVYHPAPVHGLAYQPLDRLLFSSAGRMLYQTNLEKPAVNPGPERFSNMIRQIHVHPQDPHVVLFEVDHLDWQCSLYDVRQGPFSRPPCIQFGARETVRTTRYRRGSMYMSYFALGYEDGAVRAWDFRDSSRPIPSNFNTQRTQPVCHTGFLGSDVVAYGGHLVSFWDTYNESA